MGTHFAPPPDHEAGRLRTAGLVQRGDPDPSYIRYHLPGSPCGVIYTPLLPTPWAVYWQTPCHVSDLAFCRTLDAALGLLAKIA